jgi:hypothetical protein
LFGGYEVTRADVKTRVRANLDDNAVTFFTSIDIDDSLTDAYYWSSAFANTIEKTANISFQQDCPYYNLQLIIPDHFAVTGVYDLKRHRFLTYRSRQELTHIHNSYEIWHGPPEYFFIHSQNQLFIAPQPLNISSLTQTAEQDLKIFYRAFDDNVIDDFHHSYRLPIQGEDCLEFYATADLLEQAQEWSKAQFYWDKFYAQLITSKIAIRDRPMPALLNAMAGIKL